MTTTVQTTAATVATVDEAVLKFLPFISTAIGFIPGAQVAVPFLPLVGAALVALDNAAKAVAAGDTNAAIGDVISAITSHLTPGQANAPALGPTQNTAG